jgi:hypothetical protein
LYQTTSRHITDGHNPFCSLYAIRWFLADGILRRKALDRVTCKAIATADWQTKPKQLALFRPVIPADDRVGSSASSIRFLIDQKLTNAQYLIMEVLFMGVFFVFENIKSNLPDN